MKYLLLAGAAALFSSSAWAAEPAPAAPDSPEKAHVEAAPAEAAPTQDPPQSDFCGQEMVQNWMWQTEVGKELRLKQQAALQQALAEAETARSKAQVAAPQETEPAAEAESKTATAAQ